MSENIAEENLIQEYNFSVQPEQGIDTMHLQLQRVREFVAHEMTEGKDYLTADTWKLGAELDQYGQVRKRGPYDGYKYIRANTLLKPGAEKIRELFKLGTRTSLVRSHEKWEHNYQPGMNWADYDPPLFSYDYNTEVYSLLRPEVVICNQEGSCNSREKKYFYKTAWRNGRSEKVPRTPTEVCDIKNTICKMAQKRSFVGAIIVACRLGTMFTPEEEWQVQEAERAIETVAVSDEIMELRNRIDNGFTLLGYSDADKLAFLLKHGKTDDVKKLDKTHLQAVIEAIDKELL